MVSKIVVGGDFQGAITYVIDSRKNAEIIDSEGVYLKDNNSIIDSFNTQLNLNPKITKPVYHISLNFSVQDLNILNNEKMKEIAQDYMKKMNICNTQFVAVRHFDKHPHIHLIINRVDNFGKLISTKNDRYRNEKVCKELTISNSLYYSSGKENIKTERLREPDKSKMLIYKELKNDIPNCKNWNQLIECLKAEGTSVQFIYKGKTNTVQGVIFSKNGFPFSGSKIDRKFSFSKIDFELNQNMKHLAYETFTSNDNSSQINAKMPVEVIDGFQIDLPMINSSSNRSEDDQDLKKIKKKTRKFGLNF
jgi:hypothetical protein